jgi:tetratricopeptide (TPR) repeat protein
MRNRGWVVFFSLWFIQGCAKPWIPIGDLQSRVENREVKRQLRLLSSKDEDVWQAAYWRLVDRGPSVSRLLIQALDAREPLAGRAMLVLGEVADPGTLAHLKMLQEDPRLGAAATRALEISEEAHWRRVEESQDRASCEGYLTWFPGGQHRWAVQARLHELDAQDAFERITGETSPDVMAVFLQNFGDTRLGEGLKKKMAVQAVGRAQLAMDAGEIRKALHELDQAQNLDQALNFSALEGQVRSQFGRLLVEEGERHRAIVEFVRARALGESVEMELGRLLVERARERQAERDFQGGLEDLDIALTVYPKLEAVIKRVRRDIEKQLLREIEKGTLDGDSVANALLRSGVLGRVELNRRLQGGVNKALVARLIGDAGLGTDTPEMRAFRTAAVEDVVKITQKSAEEFLRDVGRLERLLDGERLWDPAQGPTRDAARRVVGDYIRAMEWQSELGQRVATSSGQKVDRLRLVDDIDALLLEDRGPDDDSLSLTVRVQLLDRLLHLHSELQARVRQQPLLFAAGLVGYLEIPDSLTRWGAFMLKSPNPNDLKFRNGLSASMEAATVDGILRLRLLAQKAGGLDTDLAVSEALTVLFGAARSLIFHHGESKGVTVEVGTGAPFDLMVRVSLSRESIRRFNWRLIQNEAPFGMDHLAFVFDQEIH